MKKSYILPALALVFGTTLATATVDASWGQNGQGRMGGRQMMTQERFDLMREYFVNNDFEGLQMAIQTWRDERQSERETRRAYRQENITRSVENIDNGVVMILTSDDAELVEDLQSREHPQPRHEDVTRTVETLSNGVKITITSTNADEVELIQDRHKDGARGHGQRMGKGRGQGAGEFGGQRRGKGQGRGQGRWEN